MIQATLPALWPVPWISQVCARPPALTDEPVEMVKQAVLAAGQLAALLIN